MKILVLTVTLAAAVLSVRADDRQPLNRVMRTKLELTQKILEAVVTSDWAALETHSRDLDQLTDDPRWTVLKFPEYGRHSAAFKEAIRALHTAAAQRDLEAAPKAYVSVTLSCIECHRYLARARLAHR